MKRSGKKRKDRNAERGLFSTMNTERCHKNVSPETYEVNKNREKNSLYFILRILFLFVVIIKCCHNGSRTKEDILNRERFLTFLHYYTKRSYYKIKISRLCDTEFVSPPFLLLQFCFIMIAKQNRQTGLFAIVGLIIDLFLFPLTFVKSTQVLARLLARKL